MHDCRLTKADELVAAGKFKELRRLLQHWVDATSRVDTKPTDPEDSTYLLDVWLCALFGVAQTKTVQGQVGIQFRLTNQIFGPSDFVLLLKKFKALYEKGLPLVAAIDLVTRENSFFGVKKGTKVVADPLASTHVPVPTLDRPREQVTVTFFYYTLPGEMGSWKKDNADWTTMFDNANWESKHYVEGSWAFKVEQSLGKDWEKKVSGGVCVNIASICTNRCTHPCSKLCCPQVPVHPFPYLFFAVQNLFAYTSPIACCAPKLQAYTYQQANLCGRLGDLNVQLFTRCAHLTGEPVRQPWRLHGAGVVGGNRKGSRGQKLALPSLLPATAQARYRECLRATFALLTNLRSTMCESVRSASTATPVTQHQQ